MAPARVPTAASCRQARVQRTTLSTVARVLDPEMAMNILGQP